MRVSLDELQASVGKEIGISRWFLVDQERINAFAETTEDRQFIHFDPVAARETPFGGTIAHGFLTLSFLSAMAEDAVPRIEGLLHSVNYGFNRIRFVSPVKSGAQIRGRFQLVEILVGDGFISQTMSVSVEIKGSDKPALVAEWVSRHYFS